MSEKFDIYSKIFFRDVENFVRHLCVLVLRHQMQVSNYFVNSFYSAGMYCWKTSWSETIAVIASVVRSQLPVVCVNQLTAREGSDLT